MRLIALCLIAALLIGCNNQGLLQTARDTIENKRAPTNAQMIEALKTALNDGAADAALTLSAEGGFNKSSLYKIFLPPEADTIVKNVKLIPNGAKLIDDAVLRINSAAEEAAKEATPIFAKAISDMTIADAVGILKGEQNAATRYLQEKTSGALKTAFAPKINAALAKPLIAGVSAQNSWDTLTGGFNKVANSLAGKAVKLEPVKTSINDYVLDKALFALFNEVGKTEAQIRANPLASSKAIVQKVFDYAKNALNKD
ncbi:MAG: DUF4197 domain-containing protein [Helicobacteraceae bacterium]|jgi:hypothetical protein|nr:DUF4197 domain-containing protein [Helicobacteraceae bacterium]